MKGLPISHHTVDDDFVFGFGTYHFYKVGTVLMIRNTTNNESKAIYEADEDFHAGYWSAVVVLGRLYFVISLIRKPLELYSYDINNDDLTRLGLFPVNSFARLVSVSTTEIIYGGESVIYKVDVNTSEVTKVESEWYDLPVHTSTGMVSCTSDFISCVDLNGKVLWKQTTKQIEELSGLRDCRQAGLKFCIWKDKLVYQIQSNDVLALNLVDGSLAWVCEQKIVADWSANKEGFLYGYFVGYFVKIDMNNGAFEKKKIVADGMDTLQGKGRFWFIDAWLTDTHLWAWVPHRGSCNAINLETAELEWSTDSTAPPWGSFKVFGNQIFFSTVESISLEADKTETYHVITGQGGENYSATDQDIIWCYQPLVFE